MNYTDFKNLAEEINNHLLSIPKEWEGEDAIMAMKLGGSPNWRQMEWIGFYFEFLCKKQLNFIGFTDESKIFEYQNVKIDSFYKIPWDLKAHCIYDKHGKEQNSIIVNDSEAINEAIKKYTDIGIIIAMGEAVYNDESGEFKEWHDALKGEESAYQKKNRIRSAWSRRRKVSFSLKQIGYVKIDKDLLITTEAFQENFRNSNDNKRRGKVLLNLDKLESGKNVYYVDIL